MRRFFSALTTRHVTRKSARSLRNESVSGSHVCNRVSVKGRSYWHRLLHTDILPQKLSRRSAMVMIFRIVIKGVHEDGDPQVRPTQRVGHAAFVAEVRQRDQNAIDLSG